MSKPMINAFANTELLDQQLTQDVVGILTAAIEQKGKALLCVSGGSTPIGFFQLLSQTELDWSKVTITLADERWLPASHKDSNEKLLRDNLLRNQAAAARFVPLVHGFDSAEEDARQCHILFSEIDHFDLVILGMGGDGHTASLFPQADNLEQGLDLHSDLSALVVEPKTAPHTRISLTLPRLLKSQQIFIHITGQEKSSVLGKAVDSGDSKRWPITAVLQQLLVPVQVYWA